MGGGTTTGGTTVIERFRILGSESGQVYTMGFVVDGSEPIETATSVNEAYDDVLAGQCGIVAAGDTLKVEFLDSASQDIPSGDWKS